MSKVGQRDTGPEMRLRHALHKAGYRYRLNDRRLPGSPDLVFPKFHAAVFVHGCFWHAHSCKTVPSTRREFWLEKFAANKERDKRKIDQLLASGWRVLVVWECAVKKKRAQGLDELVSLVTEWLHSAQRYGEIDAERAKTYLVS